jgi:hypothetical protein
MKIKLAESEQLTIDGVVFDQIQVTRTVTLGNAEGNRVERSLSSEICFIPVAELAPGHLIFAKSHQQIIKIPDLWGYLMAHPETGYMLMAALTAVIADLGSGTSTAYLEVPE